MEHYFTRDILFYQQHLTGRMEDFSTLILGDTGTGKGTAASAIGRSGFIPFNEKTGTFSESFTKAFVSINLSQFPEGIIESELFGHRKGAFTGAVEAHEGMFDTCSPHGSIFLDEIGDISIPGGFNFIEAGLAPASRAETLPRKCAINVCQNPLFLTPVREGVIHDTV